MSEELPSVEMSAEEIRLRERRIFDAFNEAQSKRRKIWRDAGNLAAMEENKRWARPEPDAVSGNDTSHVQDPV